MVAERFAPRIDAGECRGRNRDADDADRTTSIADEQIGDQRDAERRRPAADLQHLDAVRPRPVETTPARCANRSDRPGQRDPALQQRALRREQQDAAVPSGTRIGSTSALIVPCPTSSTSSVPTVACTRCASTSENASRPKPITIAVRTSACGTGSAYGGDQPLCAARHDRRLRARQSAGGEDQQVRAVRQQAKADDQLRQPAAQHQVDAGGVEHARGQRQEHFHSGLLRQAEDHHQHHARSRRETRRCRTASACRAAYRPAPTAPSGTAGREAPRARRWPARSAGRRRAASAG